MIEPNTLNHLQEIRQRILADGFTGEDEIYLRAFYRKLTTYLVCGHFDSFVYDEEQSRFEELVMANPLAGMNKVIDTLSFRNHITVKQFEDFFK